ncbi:hypothetical protein BH10PSE1_BH10PSE1_13370 [soil metagenome]
MPELTLRFFDIGPAPLRTERLTVEDNVAAIALARTRLRDSRFKTATVHVDETFIVRIGPDGLPRRSQDAPPELLLTEPEESDAPVLPPAAGPITSPQGERRRR